MHTQVARAPRSNVITDDNINGSQEVEPRDDVVGRADNWLSFVNNMGMTVDF